MKRKKVLLLEEKLRRLDAMEEEWENELTRRDYQILYHRAVGRLEDICTQAECAVQELEELFLTMTAARPCEEEDPS